MCVWGGGGVDCMCACGGGGIVCVRVHVYARQMQEKSKKEKRNKMALCVQQIAACCRCPWYTYKIDIVSSGVARTSTQLDWTTIRHIIFTDFDNFHTTQIHTLQRQPSVTVAQIHVRC